ncbi:ABC transporter ATP-binding protein [Asticcacaulis endophyticus]|uniref:Peptide ABC transporter ATP-binding protein n=1 Tax=Asticcacaulis endophyticus TaxID=1395890 RepID=A0A918Q217_9CAUL|nr:ABC transporter ATP-binding protein [Asticcacaulis endophyticus]GGZ31123.1 peptide ABC transporter ATP-binding protein [Asticcacaulis endophyticus]
MAVTVNVSHLKVAARGEGGMPIPIIRDVSFSIKKGEVLALIGESGSGKSTIALSLMGYTRPGLEVVGGRIQVGDQDVLALKSDELRALRGKTVAYVAQSAAASFNPVVRIMDQVIETAVTTQMCTRAVAEAKAIGLFKSLALPNPETLGHRYPHEVSGGQLQRLMAAMALMADPALVIFDEPTTALDVTTQIEVLRAFKAAVKERGVTAVYVSHDLAVVAQIADQIVVLQHGEVREAGQRDQILHEPDADYTQSLMQAAQPEKRVRPSPAKALGTMAPILQIKGMKAGYGKARDGSLQKTVLDNIDLTIEPGRALGIIGESGSGKSTLARVIAGMLPPAAGQVCFHGEVLPPSLRARSRDQLRRIQIVFQNADTAINPAQTVGEVLARPLQFYYGLKGQALTKRVNELLDLIRMPSSSADRLCRKMSGGQKQRVNLARALAAKPDLILCDEVTSALDSVVAAAILDLMAELRHELNLTYVFISHDISAVRAVCDDIMVLYAGTQVEAGQSQAFKSAPYHPYTDLLISSVPQLRRGWLEEARPGSSGAQAQPEDGLCRFLPRCSLKIPGLCDTMPAPRHALSDGRNILCHLDEPSLRAAQLETV